MSELCVVLYNIKFMSNVMTAQGQIARLYTLAERNCFKSSAMICLFNQTWTRLRSYRTILVLVVVFC